MQIKRNILKFLRQLGFGERRCLQCHRPFFPEWNGSYTSLLCEQCQIELTPYIGPTCPACGIPWIPPAKKQNALVFCSNCAAQKPAWHRIAYHGLYEGALRDILLRFKFDGEINLAFLIGLFMLEASATLSAPDVLVAIPQHPVHLRVRGYNQAHEIAKTIARESGFPLRPRLLCRIRQQSKQEGLTAEQRRLNLAKAFEATPEAAGQNIWLIDDVVTTGSTCEAAVSALLAQGARSVQILAAARAVSHI